MSTIKAATHEGRGGCVSIICTQPRRIAAIAIAKRVAEERGEEPGAIVGHAVRMDTRVSQDTRLTPWKIPSKQIKCCKHDVWPCNTIIVLRVLSTPPVLLVHLAAATWS